MHDDVTATGVNILKQFNSIIFSFVSVEIMTLLESKGNLLTDGYLAYKNHS